MLAISTHLPIYSGLIESARANNRQGFPVGAAYLRPASDLMRTQILPAASTLYQVEARRLGGDYASGVSSAAVVVLVVLAVVMLGLLMAVQLYLAALTHRILSVPMAVATLVGLAPHGVVGRGAGRGAERAGQGAARRIGRRAVAGGGARAGAARPGR